MDCGGEEKGHSGNVTGARQGAGTAVGLKANSLCIPWASERQ
jgi:hypothetical protein